MATVICPRCGKRARYMPGPMVNICLHCHLDWWESPGDGGTVYLHADIFPVEPDPATWDMFKAADDRKLR